jgi:tetratricopeptide (TPR) repeat protein
VSAPGRRERILRPAGLVLLAVLAAALGRTTAARNLDYASDESIWRDTLAKQPENPRALIGLGADLLSAQRFGEAQEALKKAVALDADSAEALSNLGATELALGNADESVRLLERAVTLRPQYVDAHQNLAEAYLTRHQHAKAAPHFRLVLRTRPNRTVVLNHFGLMLALSSDDSVRNGKEALELAQRAVDLTSRRDPMSLGTLAAAMAELDRFDEAAAAAREAMALLGDDSTMKQDLQGMVSSYTGHQKFHLPAR